MTARFHLVHRRTTNDRSLMLNGSYRETWAAAMGRIRPLISPSPRVVVAVGMASPGTKLRGRTLRSSRLRSYPKLSCC